MTTRRSFLRGLFAAPAIVAASSLMPINTRLLLPVAPRLWGDGIHDDTAALQWFVDHPKDMTEILLVPDGVFRIEGPIVLRNSFHLRSANEPSGIHLINHGDGPAIIVADGAVVRIDSVHIETRHTHPTI